MDSSCLESLLCGAHRAALAAAGRSAGDRVTERVSQVDVQGAGVHVKSVCQTRKSD